MVKVGRFAVAQETIGAPLFANLYPFVVHKEVSAYNDRKRSILVRARDNLQQLDMDSMGFVFSFINVYRHHPSNANSQIVPCNLWVCRDPCWRLSSPSGYRLNC